MRLIDADALKEKAWDAKTQCGYVQVIDVGDIDDAPTIEPERKKGKWVGAIEYCTHLEETTGERYQPSGLAGMIYCNQCWHASDRRSSYCRECGAKMEEGDNT